jgi:hypothetical protein
MKSANRLVLALVAAFCALAVQQPAQAQLNNEPFSFDNRVDGGLGMSDAARQAILNQKIYGSTPDHIMIGPGGVLVEITQGPGHVALATLPDGSFLEGYKGRGLELGGISVFFDAPTRSGGFANLVIHGESQGVINAWTFGVLVGAYQGSALANRPIYSAYSSGSIDSWIAQVAGLPVI